MHENKEKSVMSGMEMYKWHNKQLVRDYGVIAEGLPAHLTMWKTEKVLRTYAEKPPKTF